MPIDPLAMIGSGQGRSPLRLVVDCALYGALVLVCVLSLFLLATDRDPRVIADTDRSSIVLQALLFRTGTAVDTFRTAGTTQVMHRSDFPAMTSDESGTAELVAPDALMLTRTKGTEIMPAEGGKTLQVDTGASSELVTVTRDGTVTFATHVRAGLYRLRSLRSSCQQMSELTLADRDPAYVPDTFFSRFSLPLQRELRLSPAETSLAVLDQQFLPRVMLVRLFPQTSAELLAPFFGPRQIHFSPAFLDEETLLFSVIDDDRWGTVLYHIPEHRYELLSDHFTDRALRSVSGKVVLLQSFYDGGFTNIPFGSLGLLSRRRGIADASVRAIVGEGRRSRIIRSLLFEHTDGPILQFKPTLTPATFLQIDQSAMREALLDLWHQYRFVEGSPAGVMRILSGSIDHLTITQAMPFTVDARVGFFQVRTNILPLLSALELPDVLLQEYTDRSIDAMEKEQSYEFVDALW